MGHDEIERRLEQLAEDAEAAGWPALAAVLYAACGSVVNGRTERLSEFLTVWSRSECYLIDREMKGHTRRN